PVQAIKKGVPGACTRAGPKALVSSRVTLSPKLIPSAERIMLSRLSVPVQPSTKVLTPPAAEKVRAGAKLLISLSVTFDALPGGKLMMFKRRSVRVQATNND